MYAIDLQGADRQVQWKIDLGRHRALEAEALSGPAHAELEFHVDAAGRKNRREERVRAIGPQGRMASFQLRDEARRQRAARCFDPRAERNRIRFDDTTSGKREQPVAASRGRCIDEANERAARDAFDDSAGPDQPGLERRRMTRTKLKDHARVERGGRFEFQRHLIRQRKFQVGRAIDKRMHCQTAIGRAWR